MTRNLELRRATRFPAEHPPGASGCWSIRTTADATSVLLELARAIRGCSSATDADRRRRGLAERAHQAIASEVERAGSFELSIRGGTIAVSGIAEQLDARAGLHTLHASLVRHGIERLRLDEALTVDAVEGLLELLARTDPKSGGADPATFVRNLTARDATGVRVNDLEPAADPLPRSLDATPPRPSLSLTTPHVRAALPPTAFEQARGPSQATPPAADLARAPLAAPAADPRGERLRARLVELDHILDDATYAARADEIVAWVEQITGKSRRDDAYRAMLVLADHAVGCGGRAESQARIAARCFAGLARGERLEDLIDRALASDESGVRAAQLLLELGEAAVAAIIDRICASPDPLAPTPLHALVITSGEAAIPTLRREIEGRDEDRARVAIRLAGALQSTALLPRLANAARHAPLARQIEAIRALCLIPGEASHAALADALASQLDQIAIAATQAIANRTGIDPVPALLDVLESHVRGSRTQFCRALIEVLARLGDERAVPRLAAILERRPVLRRAHWHAIQLAAVDALAVLPSREARRAVERAAQNATRPVRDRARDRLALLDGLPSVRR
jgi:hypothetical protein